MAKIRTTNGSFEVLELDKPVPGVIWLVPWDLMQQVKFANGRVVDRKLETFGLTLQGRAGSKKDRERVNAAIIGERNDEEEPSDKVRSRFRISDEEFDVPQEQYAVAEELQQENLHASLPETLRGGGFILFVTDRGDEGAASSVRTAREMWSMIDLPHRVWLDRYLFPFDPLWRPSLAVIRRSQTIGLGELGNIQRRKSLRMWLASLCFPCYLRMIGNPGGGRRPLRPAIPSDEPLRTLAIRQLQEAFDHERENMRRCQIRRPKRMSTAHAASILGLVPPEIQMIADTDALHWKQRHKAHEWIANKIRGLKFENLRTIFIDRWKQCDPGGDVVIDPAGYEERVENCNLLRDAWERVMFARFLSRRLPGSHPKLGKWVSKGPLIGRNQAEEIAEAAKQLQKIVRYEDGVFKFARDAQFVEDIKSSTLKIEEDEYGQPSLTNLSSNLVYWIYKVYGVLPTPDVIEVIQDDAANCERFTGRYLDGLVI